MLIDGKKFALRIYVLVTSLDPLIAYVADEGMVRICTEDYQKPTKDNLDNLLQHLTNYSLNKLSNKYKNSEGINSEE